MFKIDVLQAHLLCNLRTWSPKPLKKTLKSSKLNNRKHKIYDHPHYKAKRINNKKRQKFQFLLFLLQAKLFLLRGRLWVKEPPVSICCTDCDGHEMMMAIERHPATSSRVQTSTTAPTTSLETVTNRCWTCDALVKQHCIVLKQRQEVLNKVIDGKG